MSSCVNLFHPVEDLLHPVSSCFILFHFPFGILTECINLFQHLSTSLFNISFQHLFSTSLFNISCQHQHLSTSTPLSNRWRWSSVRPSALRLEEKPRPGVAFAACGRRRGPPCDSQPPRLASGLRERGTGGHDWVRGFESSRFFFESLFFFESVLF